ncbi:P-loop containing nucleoside triphosphate hydrolase protein, partial [Nadsonia fulvescens var. elongata DSM 6958]
MYNNDYGKTTADVETPKHPESFQAQIDLNQQQLNAVQHPVDSKLMVVAGPGTGKTHVLVARVLYLIQLGVPPEKIVVTTFTNRVTSTLISRISQIAGSDISNRLQIHNFYSICQGLLHTFGAKLDIDTDFDVADEIELESITDDVVSSFTTYPRERDSIKSRIKKFYMSKQSGLDVEILKDDIVSNLVEKTQNILHERKLLSYHDLLELGTELVERFPSSVNQVEATLVDEFQDLSPLHWRFIKGLSQ